MSITKIIISQDEYEDTITNVSKKAAAVVLELWILKQKYFILNGKRIFKFEPSPSPPA